MPYKPMMACIKMLRLEKPIPVHIVIGTFMESQWTKIVRLNRKHTLYIYKAVHAAHSALSYNGSYSVSLFLSTEVLHALLCLLLHTRQSVIAFIIKYSRVLLICQ